jgi:Mlc titration factor MtfA (ptsG expression regulator)
MQVFMAEKRFEGVKGVTVTEEMSLLVAAQACLLLLHRDTGYFPRMTSVVIYPGEFRSTRHDWDDAGVVTEWMEIRSGESFSGGTVVLSWEDIRLGLRDDWPGYNVVIHEFAHQLDEENGVLDGTPPMPTAEWQTFVQVMQREYNLLLEEDEKGEETFLDPYGAEHPVEYFAVAAESFFTQPRDLNQVHPELYQVLARYFRQDPAAQWSSDENHPTLGHDQDDAETGGDQ